MSDFQFDPNKQVQNLNKHGISFELASTVLDDPYSATFDDYGDHDEERYFTIGMSENGQILIVNWTIRDDELRIISSRPAEPNQRRDYYANRR